ncbi:acyl-CoA dehydrogenase family protein [Nocardia sp. CA-107356]|uniref:acyl-CoA dehydrogenase family protein n=1 Tax=Nocardia sp. CA-107356 TaxID=3239972 RepID=UPI003D8DF4E9
MTEIESELTHLLQMVRGLATKKPYSNADAASMLGPLRDTGLLDLAADTFEIAEIDALDWASQVIQEVGRESGSVAYFLASRYVSHRAQLRRGVDLLTSDSVAAIAHSASGELRSTTAPLVVTPAAVLLLDPTDAGVLAVSTTEFEVVTEVPKRTGLGGAALGGICAVARPDDRLPDQDAWAACADWDILVASAALGVADAALSASADYARTRRQFGSAIGSFAGLRAIVAEMADQIDCARGLLTTAVTSRPDPRDRRVAAAAAAARACRAAVGVALSAVQVHGGYGYIDEFAVAGHVRDALSLRARCSGTLIARRLIASEHLGSSDTGKEAR